MESHQRDHENYVACSRSHRRRAKALLDFERHDDDELGFRKNDIITVRGGSAARGCWEWVRVGLPPAALRLQPGHPATCALPLLGASLRGLAKDGTRWCRGAGRGSRAGSLLSPLQIVSQKDEHCWVGELNGLRGEALVPVWGSGLGSEAAPPTPSPHELASLSSARRGGKCEHTRPLTGPCLSPRLVSCQVCGSSRRTEQRGERGSRAGCPGGAAPSLSLGRPARPRPGPVFAVACGGGSEARERLAAGTGLGPFTPCPHRQYSIAGDDAVTEAVTDLVRGTLCPALKALFEHGLKKPSLLGGACHPWLFIEEVSQWLDPRPPLSFSPCAWVLGSWWQELMGWPSALRPCGFDLGPIPLSLTLSPSPGSRPGGGERL